MSIESYLKTICDVINRELIPQTLALNGWKFSDEEMPKLVYGDLDDRDLDDLGKFIQRVVSVNSISVDKTLDSALRKIAKLPAPDYDNPMPSNDTDSRAGDGYKTAGEGTSDSISDDASVGNTENA